MRESPKAEPEIGDGLVYRTCRSLQLRYFTPPPDRARPPFRRGDRVRIIRGPFRDQLAIFAGTRPRERVEALPALFGNERHLEMPRRDIERSYL